MENITKIEEFVTLESGNGRGSGSGSGSGYGSGIKSINGNHIWMIDDQQTIIDRVRGNVAKGGILRSDLTIMPCYIVKQDGLFAHGETLRDAMDALRDKLYEDMPEDERIQAFVQSHGLSLDGKTTVEEFIRLTEHDCGGKVVRKLKPYYEEVNND